METKMVLTLQEETAEISRGLGKFDSHWTGRR